MVIERFFCVQLSERRFAEQELRDRTRIAVLPLGGHVGRTARNQLRQDRADGAEPLLPRIGRDATRFALREHGVTLDVVEGEEHAHRIAGRHEATRDERCAALAAREAACSIARERADVFAIRRSEHRPAVDPVQRIGRIECVADDRCDVLADCARAREAVWQNERIDHHTIRRQLAVVATCATPDCGRSGEH